MILKRDTDYAIRLLVCYARGGDGDDSFVFRREALRETDIPAQAHSRICRLLREHGFLESATRGRETGYRLALPPQQITLRGVIELTESHVDLLAVFDKRAKIYSNKAWEKLQSTLNRNLEAITVAELME